MSMRGLFDRIVNEIQGKSEDQVVQEFLAASENFKKLKEIKKTSKQSKKGTPLWNGWNQIHESEEKQIKELNTANSFAHALKILHIEPEKIPPALETSVSLLSNVYQKANFSIYALGLAREIIDYAKKHNYDVSETAQNRCSLQRA